jgi:predicted nucleic acid-binding protein
MIHADTSALIGALTGDHVAAPALRRFVRDGMRLGVSTIVLFEWWRGPRNRDELQDQEQLFPSAAAVAFGIREARIAAELYRQARRARTREADIAIAACAIAQNAALWTLNPRDFADIPDLMLV